MGLELKIGEKYDVSLGALENGNPIYRMVYEGEVAGKPSFIIDAGPVTIRSYKVNEDDVNLAEENPIVIKNPMKATKLYSSESHEYKEARKLLDVNKRKEEVKE